MKLLPRLAAVTAVCVMSSAAMAQVLPVTAHDYVTFTLSGDATFTGTPDIWNMNANAGGQHAPSDSVNWSIGANDSAATLYTHLTSTTLTFRLDASSLWNGYYITPSIRQAIAVGAGGGTLTVSYDVFTDVPASQAGLDFGGLSALYVNQALVGVGSNAYAAGGTAEPDVGQSAHDAGTQTFALSAAAPFTGISIDVQLLNNGAVAAPVPEPETWALLGMGLVGVIGAARRRKLARAVAA